MLAAALLVRHVPLVVQLAPGMLKTLPVYRSYFAYRTGAATDIRRVETLLHILGVLLPVLRALGTLLDVIAVE